MNAPVRTRLAPTPSGHLHAGNAFSFLCAWLASRSRGGEVVLRIEDVDVSRARPSHVEALFRDLDWLGLDWDRGPEGPRDLESEFRQSSRGRQERYAAVWADWRDRGLLYPCVCTRAQLRSDAPQAERLGEEAPPGPPYPGTCRGRNPSESGASDSWRLRLPDSPSSILDGWRGERGLSSLAEPGDPVVRRGDGVFAYHLAVCVDDVDQGIDLVVRGRDLLAFSHLHVHLRGLLGASAPTFLHHPLLGSPDGARLAKRAGSSSLSAMRESGIDSRIPVGKLAPLLFADAGLDGAPVSLRELLSLGVPRPGTVDLPCPELPSGGTA